MSEMMKVSSNPHVRSKVTTSNVMIWVAISLLPAAGFGIYNFGIDELIILALSVFSTVLSEFIYEKLMHKKITIGDFSAVVTGLLLGMNLPSTVPWWIPILGGMFAIIWRTGTELHEPCTWWKMLFGNIFPGYHDQFCNRHIYRSNTSYSP